MSSTPSLSVEDEKKLEAGVVEDQPTLPYTQEVPDVDPEMSRRLVRKFDRWLLPLIAIMYLCNNLDKCMSLPCSASSRSLTCCSEPGKCKDRPL